MRLIVRTCATMMILLLLGSCGNHGSVNPKAGPIESDIGAFLSDFELNATATMSRQITESIKTVLKGCNVSLPIAIANVTSDSFMRTLESNIKVPWKDGSQRERKLAEAFIQGQADALLDSFHLADRWQVCPSKQERDRLAEVFCKQRFDAIPDPREDDVGLVITLTTVPVT